MMFISKARNLYCFVQSKVYDPFFPLCSDKMSLLKILVMRIFSLKIEFFLSLSLSHSYDEILIYNLSVIAQFVLKIMKL